MKKEYCFQFLLFISALILIALISLRWYFRVDTTRQKTYTLSAYTQEALYNLGSTVQVTWFKSKNVFSFFPSLRYLEDMLSEYRLHADGKFIFFEKDTAELSDEAIRELGLISRQVETQNNSAFSLYTIYSGLMLEYKGQTRIIPFIDDIDILEYDIGRFLSDIEAVTQGLSPRNIAVIAPKAALENEYRYVTAWLEYAGFTVHSLDLPLAAIDAEMPLLVIGSDYIDFSSAAAIDTFLKKEGAAIFFVSGNTVDVKGKWTAKPKTRDFLLDVLAKQGFYINADLILDPVNFRITMSAVDNTGIKTVNYPFWIRILQNNIQRAHPIFAAYKPLQTFWPSSISVDTERNKTVSALGFTSPSSVTMIDSYDTEPFGNQRNALTNFEKSSHAVVAGYEKPSRVLVVSDEYMIGSAIDYTGSTYNLDFLINCVEYICKKDNLIALKNKKHSASPFKQFNDNAEFNAIVFKARFISFVILPLLIAVLAAVSFMQRRKET